MPRLSNEELMGKTVITLKQYANDHPSESGRIGNLLFKESRECYGISVKYHASKLIPQKPERITIEFD